MVFEEPGQEEVGADETQLYAVCSSVLRFMKDVVDRTGLLLVISD